MDYFETFSPITSLNSIRILFSTVVNLSWPCSSWMQEWLSNQSSIHSLIIKNVTTVKPQIHIGFHWSTSMFKPQKSWRKIQSILPLREKYIMFFMCNFPRKYLGLPISLVIKWRLRYTYSCMVVWRRYIWSNLQGMLLRERIKYVISGRQYIGSSRVRRHGLRSLASQSLTLIFIVSTQISRCLFRILSLA